MTDQFSKLLNLGYYISHIINAAFIVCCIYVSFCAWKKTAAFNKRIIYISAFTAFIVAQVLFEVWWYYLNNSASSPEDHKWLNEHDGGGHTALFIINCFKAIICGVTSYVAANIIIKKRLNLQV